MRAWQIWVAPTPLHEPSLFTQRLVESEAEVVAQKLRDMGRVAEVREIIVQATEREA